jgi:hypothetical protein
MEDIPFDPPSTKKVAYWNSKDVVVSSILDKSIEERRCCCNPKTKYSGIFVDLDWVMRNRVRIS